MNLKSLIDKLVREQTRPKLYHRIRSDHILDQQAAIDMFEPNKGYFRIRLSEMFLRDKRVGWRGFIPLGILVCRFNYGMEKQISVPFFVGNNLLKELEQYIEGDHVAYLNTVIVGPIPYLGDDISLFVGLFRCQVSDLAENLLGFLETIVRAFDVSKLSSYLPIAKALSQGMGGLLGADEVEFRLGTQDVFSDQLGDPHQFKAGYFVYMNCPENQVIADHLWIRDGRLCLGKDKESLASARDYDYCLVRIEHLSERNDYTTLSFHKFWEESKKEIWQGEHVKAKELLLRLFQQLAVSPDVTENHRYYLIQTYLTFFEKEVELYQKAKGFVSEGKATVYRGRDAILSGKKSIQLTAHLASKAGFSAAAVEGLYAISENWNQVPELPEDGEGVQLTEDLLSRQMNAFKSMTNVGKPDAKYLADAITVATLKPN